MLICKLDGCCCLLAALEFNVATRASSLDEEEDQANREDTHDGADNSRNIRGSVLVAVTARSCADVIHRVGVIVQTTYIIADNPHTVVIALECMLYFQKVNIISRSGLHAVENYIGVIFTASG